MANYKDISKNKKTGGSKRIGLKSWVYLVVIFAGFLSIVWSGLYFTIGTGVDSLSDGQNPIAFYLNLANPYMRYVNIPAGLRMEEIADKYATALSWDEVQKQKFLAKAPKDERGSLDGFFLPASYWVHVDSSGEQVANQMLEEFNEQVSEKILSKRSKNQKDKINLETAVRIASIIQREAAGPADMKLISGVIWNRLFNGMSLDMDATLQYVKGTPDKWWPKVASKDKYLDSPYNTYANKGLPPTAIANPSVAAIEAAYFPSKTNCLFYLHDANRKIHCSKTYSEHKDNIRRFLSGTGSNSRRSTQ